MGVISDQIGSLNGNVNLILCFGVGLAVLGFGAIASGIEVPLSLVSSLIGVSYGAVFTLFPTLCAYVWGVEILGSTWGLFLSAPAVGAVLFGMFFASEYDQYCPQPGCLSFPFGIFCFLFVLSGILIRAIITIKNWKNCSHMMRSH